MAKQVRYFRQVVPHLEEKYGRERIYPSIAVFDALCAEGASRKEAEDFVTDYYRWRSGTMVIQNGTE